MKRAPGPNDSILSLAPRSHGDGTERAPTSAPASHVPPFGLALRRAVADLVLQTTSEGVWLVDAQARTSFVNERVARLLGYTVDELLAMPGLELVDEEGQKIAEDRIRRRQSGIEEQYELRARRKDGSPLWLLVNANPVYDRTGGYAGSLAMVSDLSEQKAREHELQAKVDNLERRLEESQNEAVSAKAALESQIYRDSLTGLYNRRYFDERLAQEAERCKRHVRRLCLLFIDVDGFKRINDNYGHLVGDQALRGLGRVLVGPPGKGARPMLRTSDVAARYGGDEIAILAPETSLEGGHSLAERILDRVRSSPMMSIEHGPLPLGISIGVAVCPLHAAAPEELVASADRAMYQAKQQGGGRVCFAEVKP